MPRPKRICIPGLPHHVVQRGNNKQPTFFHRNDYVYYLDLLGEAATQHQVAIHAYALMTNHVHLMVTPATSDGISLFMQSVGRRFVQTVNKRYSRTGTLWEGRFKCSIIETDRYCLACYRYIDLNPLRAQIVKNPGDYLWSSYRHNAFGETNDVLTPHSTFLSLGSTTRTRGDKYRRLVSDSVDENTLKAIRYGARKGLPIGSERFKKTIEEKLGISIGDGKVGRPVGSSNQKYRKNKGVGSN